VLPATSRDDTLPMLTGVCLDIRGDVVTLAATDRYRLAVRDLHWAPEHPGVRAMALVPGRTLADAARVMAPGVPVSVAFVAPEEPEVTGRGDPRPVEGMISFDSGGRRLTGRLLAGEFIRYESRFPAEYGCRAEMPAASLIEAVRRVSLVADRASPVRLTFGPGRSSASPRTSTATSPRSPSTRTTCSTGSPRRREGPGPPGTLPHRPAPTAVRPRTRRTTGQRPPTADPPSGRPSGWSSPARPGPRSSRWPGTTGTSAATLKPATTGRGRAFGPRSVTWWCR
jgi:hypothetical protein